MERRIGSHHGQRGSKAVRLLARVVWVLCAFVVARVVAATVTTVGFLSARWTDPGTIAAAHETIGWMIGLSAVLILGYALVPAMLVIAIAEGFGVRSVIAYAVAGGAGALLLYCGAGFGPDASAHPFLTHEGEVIAAAGIAGGLAYWALAGRRAGAWRPHRAPLPVPAPDRPGPAA